MPAKVFVTRSLEQHLLEECQEESASQETSFVSSLRQLCNVASLPGIVQCSVGLPDIHAGYGFSIGNVAAFDMSDPQAVVSPGGVGFDINCGVRLLRTSLTEQDVRERQELLAQAILDSVPVGVGGKSPVQCTLADIDAMMELGMQWAVQHGFAWPQDPGLCEESGCIPGASKKAVGQRAKRRGMAQLGTLGAGNHYIEIQAVDCIYDPVAAAHMGITKLGQVCIMIHCGSRGLGHQVASDYLQQIEQDAEQIAVNDRQLACTPIHSQLGQSYLAAMAAAANFAFVNRSVISTQVRACFARVFEKSAQQMDMGLVYDVAHNIAKQEMHRVDGCEKKLLVHRKGATRAFGPNHPSLPIEYTGSTHNLILQVRMVV